MPKQASVSGSTSLVDVQKLRYFAEIVACGSFTRAGINLDLAQSALSRHIRELELQFGKPLFYRTGRGVVATDFAQYILPRVRALLFELEQFSDDIARESSVVRGQVRLAILSSLSDLLLTPLLIEVSERFPAIEMHVLEGLANHLEEWLATGRADIGVVYKNHKDRFKSEFLTSADLYLISRKGDTVTQDSTIPLRDVSSLPMVLPALPNRWRLSIEDACATQGITLLMSFQLDSIQTIKDLVMMGGRYSILPPHAVHRELINDTFLLCHKFCRSKFCWQHGQRGSVREIARAMAMRTEVIEFGTFRSGRIGGSAGSITCGKGMFFDERGFAWS